MRYPYLCLPMLSLYFVLDLAFDFLLWIWSMRTLFILECFLYARSIRASCLVLVPQLAGGYVGPVVTPSSPDLHLLLLPPLTSTFVACPPFIAALYTTPPS